jgi:hypothetical protein
MVAKFGSGSAREIPEKRGGEIHKIVIFSKVNRFSEEKVGKHSAPLGHAVATSSTTASARELLTFFFGRLK